MLPMFNKFDKFKNRQNKDFKVIVKSQRYAIQNNKGYSGHWHSEGYTCDFCFFLVFLTLLFLFFVF